MSFPNALSTNQSTNVVQFSEEDTAPDDQFLTFYDNQVKWAYLKIMTKEKV